MRSLQNRLVHLFAFLAFAMCLAGGIWILTDALEGDSVDKVSMGIGLYFCGKAFFVGPMLVIAGAQLGRMPAPRD